MYQTEAQEDHQLQNGGQTAGNEFLSTCEMEKMLRSGNSDWNTVSHKVKWKRIQYRTEAQEVHHLLNGGQTVGKDFLPTSKQNTR